MQTSIERLIIFDYSGTLSIEATSFGKPENLIRALAASGLAGFGITNPAIFWEKIVLPTWDEAGRTRKGYARTIAERIFSLWLPLETKNGGAESPPLRNSASCLPPQSSFPLIEAAADRFVFLYLDHSRPDNRWRPLLERLVADSRIVIAIATDHYAEATGAIIRHLDKWGITAIPLEGRPASQHVPLPLIVANSADTGFWKADHRFWDILHKRLPTHFQSIVVVDDFGANEAEANGYGKPDLVYERRKTTEMVIRESFQTSVITIPFVIGKNKGKRYPLLSEKIREATKLIEAAVDLS